MKRTAFTILGAAGLVAAALSGQASAATVPNGSLSVSLMTGAIVTLAPTSNIAPGLTSKTLGNLTLTAVGGNLGTNSGTIGVVPGAAVMISPNPVPIGALGVVLPSNETVTIGTLTFSFTTRELQLCASSSANWSWRGVRWFIQVNRAASPCSIGTTIPSSRPAFRQSAARSGGQGWPQATAEGGAQRP